VFSAKKKGRKNPGKFSETLQQRFEGKFRVTPGCWPWTGSKTLKGYGQLRWKYNSLVASRVSYELYVGPIPEGLMVRHRCDNPSCVNPDHLELGTAADNSADMVQRGRHNNGSLAIQRGLSK